MKKYQWCIPYLAVVLGMFIATKYDLTLARWFYHPNQPLGIFFERIALLPIEFMIPICFFGLFQRNQHVVNGARLDSMLEGDRIMGTKFSMAE